MLDGGGQISCTKHPIWFEIVFSPVCSRQPKALGGRYATAQSFVSVPNSHPEQIRHKREASNEMHATGTRNRGKTLDHVTDRFAKPKR